MEIIPVNTEDAIFARGAVLDWFGKSGRDFPWRHSRTPYRILIAEMMLRRTQAHQVSDVYQRFLATYPDIKTLNEASEESVGTLLYPLGLHWRAANFKSLASVIMEQYDGNVPHNRDELLELPGVGPYVADAVRIFAFGKTETLADTNTVRVAARYFGFSYTPESRRRPAIVKTISYLIDTNHPVESNYALLDFAALICKARSPRHEICPLASRCRYRTLLVE